MIKIHLKKYELILFYFIFLNEKQLLNWSSRKQATTIKHSITSLEKTNNYGLILSFCVCLCCIYILRL